MEDWKIGKNATIRIVHVSLSLNPNLIYNKSNIRCLEDIGCFVI